MQYLNAFVTGGIICIIGQIIINKTRLTPAHVLVLFVTLGAVLTAVGIYEPIVKFGGAGATVPISGFGYALAKGAVKGSKRMVFWGLTGGISSTAGGITAAIVFGYLMALLFNPKTKP